MTDRDHRVLIDRSTGRPILMSPGRRARPRNTDPGDDRAADCPFCEGHEDKTTEEIDAVRAPHTVAGSPGWQARAFANMYPAGDHHEVIAEGARHTVHPAELTIAELEDSLTLYRRRIGALEARADVACAFLFKNVGAGAGSSIAHNHSQLLGLPGLPPRLQSELSRCASDGCFLCAEVATASSEDRVIAESAAWVFLSPSTPKLPFEAWLLPRAHAGCFLETRPGDGVASALHAMFGAVSRAFDGCPFNSYLHRVPGADFHWHFEIQPRVGQLAALELGGDMYINSVPAAESALRWRAAT